MKGELLLKDLIKKIQNRVQVEKYRTGYRLKYRTGYRLITIIFTTGYRLITIIFTTFSWIGVLSVFFYVTDDCVVNPF